MLNAIEQGIITKSTKKRLDELESTKENLETEIAKENISHPLLTKEFLYSWFDGFKNFDVNKLENRKMLIDTFVNSVVLYDDRIDFYFNFKDNAKSLTLSELNTVSDLSSLSPPRRRKLHIACGDFFIASHSFRCSSFPQKSRSARLFGCKRPHDGSLSLPTFADFGRPQVAPTI